jgi:hypothetical protein
MRQRVQLTIVAAFIAVVGCGLSDYEKRMDEQRDRLTAFDEEAKILGGLIEQPYTLDAKGKRKGVLPFDIFFRAPKGISPAFKGREAIYLYAEQPLYRYFGPGDVNVFLAAAKMQDKRSKAIPKENEISAEDFRFRVRGGLQDYFQREHKVTIELPEKVDYRKEKKIARRGGVIVDLDLDVLEFEDPRQQAPSRVYLFFNQKFDRQVAIAFQTPKQQTDAGFLKAMDVSLKSLEISPLATQMRRAMGR